MLKFYRFLIFSAAFALFTGPGFAQSPLLYGPYVSQVTTSSIAITWITDENTSDNKVVWGIGTPDKEEPETSSEKNPAHNMWNHIVYLKGLTANTEYTYKVTSSGTESPEYSFRSAVKWGEPFSFGNGSDNQGTPDKLGHQLENAIQEGLHFYIFAADFIGTGTNIEERDGWEGNLFNVAAKFPNDYGVSKNFMASHAIYNSTSWHDLGGDGPQEGVNNYSFFWTFPENGLPPGTQTAQSGKYRPEHTYSVAYGNTFIIFISDDADCGGATAEDQAHWVDTVLASAKTKYSFLLAVSHMCVYGTGTGDNRAWENQLVKHNATIHFHGHDHNFKHDNSDGVSHITGPPSDKGEYGRITVTRDKMQFQAFNENGDLKDNGTLTWDPNPNVVVPVSDPVNEKKSFSLPFVTSGMLDFSTLENVKAVTVYDMSGAKRLHKAMGEKQAKVDLDKLEEGRYIISIRTDEDKISQAVLRLR